MIQRKPFTSDTYARDEREDEACFHAIASPALGQRVLAAFLRVEDLLLEAKAARAIVSEGVIVESSAALAIDLSDASIERLALALASLIEPPAPRAKPGPKPKTTE